MSQQLLDKYYKSEDHPFHVFERKIVTNLDKGFTVVDAGCGAEAPLLVNLVGKARDLIGVDLVDFHQSLHGKGISLLNNDLANIEVESSSVDMVVSRSVLEHVRNVDGVYKEINRILKPGGRFLFLVPNLWDYVSLASYMIPNTFHKTIVARLSDRAPDDTFPTYYRSNTNKSIRRLARTSGFAVNSIEYFGQYPYMLQFNGLLFYLGILYDKTLCKTHYLKYLRGWILAELTKTN